MYFEIYGYDSNFDFGGSHVRPLLCTVKANSIEQVEKICNDAGRILRPSLS